MDLPFATTLPHPHDLSLHIHTTPIEDGWAEDVSITVQAAGRTILAKLEACVAAETGGIIDPAGPKRPPAMDLLEAADPDVGYLMEALAHSRPVLRRHYRPLFEDGLFWQTHIAAIKSLEVAPVARKKGLGRLMMYAFHRHMRGRAAFVILQASRFATDREADTGPDETVLHAFYSGLPGLGLRSPMPRAHPEVLAAIWGPDLPDAKLPILLTIPSLGA